MTEKVLKTVRLAANRDAQIAEYAEKQGISKSDAFRKLLDRGIAATALTATPDTWHGIPVTDSAQPSQSRKQPDAESEKNTLNARLIRSIQLPHRVNDHLDSPDTAEVFLSNPELCRECLRAVRYPVTVSCPYCGSEDRTKEGNVTGTNRQSYFCNSCDTHYNILTNTIFEDHNFDLGEMCYIIKEIEKEKTPADISSNLNRTANSVETFVEKVEAVTNPEPE